jgi:hypothetical protein
MVFSFGCLGDENRQHATVPTGRLKTATGDAWPVIEVRGTHEPYFGSPPSLAGDHICLGWMVRREQFALKRELMRIARNVQDVGAVE